MSIPEIQILFCLKLSRDAQLDSQRASNPLVDGLRSQVRWLSFGPDINPFKRFNPVRPLFIWYNSQRMDAYVSQEIDRRVAEYKKAGLESVKGRRSIMNLVLVAYFTEHPIKEVDDIDSTFKTFSMSQIKQFLFSGHDTTSSTVCYLFYIFATKPVVLTRLRNEHAAVLHPDASDTASVIISQPHVLNQLSYTLAIIKEVLRLYPAVSSTRAGEPNYNVSDEAGHLFPTDGFLVWANPHCIHRDPAYWPRPNDFLPERWLVGPGDPLYPVKGAWRPFEHGPRNCIGQELAMLEMKVIIAMTVRRFHVSLAYDELDRGKGKGGIRTAYGERGYQVGRAQPSEDLPVRVTAIAESKKLQ